MKPHRGVSALFLAAVAALALVRSLHAAELLSVDDELRRVQELQSASSRLSAQREATDIQKQLDTLREQLKESQISGTFYTGSTDVLLRQIDALEMRIDGLSKIVVDFQSDYAAQHGMINFPGVKNRIAVFAYDDPDKTGLGNAISLLLTKKSLFSSRVSSFAVVDYNQGTSPTADSKLAYFDKVDALTSVQHYLLALWGRVVRTADGVRIDSFMQLSPDDPDSPFAVTIRIPDAKKDANLTARVTPSRVQTQSIEIPQEQVSEILHAAEQLAILREGPDTGSPKTGALEQYRPYTVVDFEGDWAKIQTGDSSGWTSVDAFCTGACQKVLDAARVAIDTVALANNLPAGKLPETATQDVAVLYDQITAVRMLGVDPAGAAKLATRWTEQFSPYYTKAAPQPPGGAAFANILSVAEAYSAILDSSFDKGVAAKLAKPLATASVLDPNNVEVVDNLAVLFNYYGDKKRSTLAADIARTLRQTQ
jgi:hypothetical protein